MATAFQNGPPVFCIENPEQYFIKLETYFREAGIHDNDKRFQYVVRSFDTKILEAIPMKYIRDYSYRALKCYTTSGLARTVDARSRMQKCELGNRNPSELLYEMSGIAAGILNNNKLKRLWLNALPVALRVALYKTGGSLGWRAKEADKILKMANSHTDTAVQTSLAEKDLKTEHSSTLDLKTLMEAITTLSNEVAEMESSQVQQQQSQTAQNPASLTQASSSDHGNDNGKVSLQDAELSKHHECTSQNTDKLCQPANILQVETEKEEPSKATAFYNFLLAEMNQLNETFDEVKDEIESILMKAKQNEIDAKQSNRENCALQSINPGERPRSSHSTSEDDFSFIDADSMSPLSTDKENN